MTFIVSANYLDRKSAKKWLIRDPAKPEIPPEAFDTVVATGVRFRESPELEDGFGCATVAFCDAAIGSNLGRDNAPQNHPLPVRLHFSYDRFYRSRWWRRKMLRVDLCLEMHLLADGKIFARV